MPPHEKHHHRKRDAIYEIKAVYFLTSAISQRSTLCGDEQHKSDYGRNLTESRETSVQSNLTTGRIAAAHRRFNGIRQVAQVCTPTYTCFLWVHPSPNPKRRLDRFSRFCRAHYRPTVTDRPTDRPRYSVCNNRPLNGCLMWLRGPTVEHRSLAGVLSLSCT